MVILGFGEIGLIHISGVYGRKDGEIFFVNKQLLFKF